MPKELEFSLRSPAMLISQIPAPSHSARGRRRIVPQMFDADLMPEAPPFKSSVIRPQSGPKSGSFKPVDTGGPYINASSHGFAVNDADVGNRRPAQAGRKSASPQELALEKALQARKRRTLFGE